MKARLSRPSLRRSMNCVPTWLDGLNCGRLKTATSNSADASPSPLSHSYLTCFSRDSLTKPSLVTATISKCSAARSSVVATTMLTLQNNLSMNCYRSLSRKRAGHSSGHASPRPRSVLSTRPAVSYIDPFSSRNIQNRSESTHRFRRRAKKIGCQPKLEMSPYSPK